MLVLGVAILLAVVAFGRVDRGGDGDGQTAGALLVRGADGWRYTGGTEQMVAVTLDRVIDGDTIDVRPFGGGVLRVRLFGANAPERTEPCGGQATAALLALAGNAVRLLPDQRLEDDAGRQLRYVFTAAGESIDAALIETGFATAWRADGALRDQLLALEEEAREADRGCLWSDG